MPRLSVRLPLRIRRLNEECIAVEDAAGTRLSYVYIDTDDTRRRSRGAVTPDQGIAIAQTIARALTAEIERQGGEVATS